MSNDDTEMKRALAFAEGKLADAEEANVALQGPQPSETRLARSQSYKGRSDRLEAGVAKALVVYEADDGSPAEAGDVLASSVVALLPPALQGVREMSGLDELAEVLARLEYAGGGQHG